MNHANLLSATLGLPPSWRVNDVRLSAGEKRIDMHIIHTPGSATCCPRCGNEAIAQESAEEHWINESFLNYQAHIVANILHISCPCFCGVQRLSPPWERSGSHFILCPSET